MNGTRAGHSRLWRRLLACYSRPAFRAPVRALRPSPCAVAVCAALLSAGFDAAAQQIVPDGRTATSLATRGNVTDVSTGTRSGANAFNSFSRFGVDAGNVVNLHVPTAAANLINIVRDERTNVYGILNSIKDGRVGGNVWFANPHGFVVGATGVVNAGSLTVTTPTQAFVDSFFLAPGSPNEAAVAQLLAGTAPRSGTGLISIQGTVNAADGISLLAGTINVGGTLYSGARFVGSAPDFRDVVNANGLVSATNVVVKEGRIAIAADSDVAVAGTIAAPGGPGVRGGDISIRAGGNLELNPGANIVARGLGESSAGGTVYMYGGNDAAFRQGATIDASAGASGDGGFIEFSAKNNVELAGGEFRAVAPGGKRGSVLIDPATATVSADFYSGGANHTITADDSITVNPNVTVSTRNVVGGAPANQETAASAGDSGELTLQAASIELKSGSKLLAHADNGFTGGTVTLAASSQPAVSILGYREATASIRIGEAAGGATVRGESVDIKASTDVSTKWIYQTSSGGTFIDDPTDLNTLGRTLALGASTAAEAAVGFLATLLGVNIVHSQAVGTSSIVLKGGSVVEGKQNVTLRAENTTVAGAAPSTGINGPGTQVNTPLGLGALYARNKADASVTVENNATIKGQNLTVRAHNDATLEASVAAADAGSDSGSISIAVGVTNADIQSKAVINEGANLNVTGNISVAATNKNALGNTVEAQTGDAGKASAAVAVSEFSSKATAELNANVRDAASVEVVAINENTQNITTANSKTGSTLNDMIIAGVQQKLKPLTDPTGALENYFWDKLLNKQPDEKVKPKSTPFRIGGAIAYATSAADAMALIGPGVNVHATGDAVVAARTKASDIQIAAESSAVSQSRERAAADTARNTFSAGVAIGDYEHTALAKVGANSVVTAPRIAVSSDVIIPVRETLITGGTFDRWDGLKTVKSWFDSVTNIFDVFNGASAAKSTSDNSNGSISLSGSVSILGFTNTARSVLDTSAKLNVSGNESGPWNHQFEVIPADPGATPPIDQLLHEWTFGAPAHVRAARETALLFHGGHFIPASAGGGSSSKALGIAYTQENLSGTSEAIVREGAAIRGVDETASAADADGLRTWTANSFRTTGEAQVTAEGKDLLISIATAAGFGSTFGLNGSASIVVVDNNTRALVDDEATLKSDKVSVLAQESPVTWSLAGGFNKSESAGVGIGIAYIGVTSNAHAQIADNDAYAGELVSRASQISAAGFVAARDIMVEARTGGRVEAIAVTGAVASSSDNPNQGFFAGIKSKYEAVQSKLAGLLDLKPQSTSQSGSAGSQGTGSKPTFGLSGAGSAAVNEVEQTTEARVEGATIDQNVGTTPASLVVRGVADTDIVTATGAASLTRANNSSQTGSAAISGSISVNLIDNTVESVLRDSTVTSVNDVHVQALAGGEQLSIAIGVAIDASNQQSKNNSLSATGSLSLSIVGNDVLATIDNTDVTGEAGVAGRDVNVTGYNRTFIGTGGGTLALGGKTGAGGSVTYSDVTNNVTASIAGGSVIGAVDTVGVRAYNATEIGAGAAHGQASNAQNANALGGAAVITEITNNTTASIAGSTVTATGTVQVLAKDQGADNALEQIIEPGSERENTVAGLDYCGRDAAGVGATPSGNCITSVAGVVQVGRGNNIGLSFNWSEIHNNLTAKIENSTVTTGSSQVAVKAESNATITSFALGVGASDKVSGAGSVAVNRIDNNILAAATGNSALTADTVTIDAKDKSRIDTLGGQINIGKSAAVGAAVTYSEIGNEARAVADQAAINAQSSAMLAAENDSRIHSLAVAGTLAVGSGAPAVSASISVNFIGNKTEATADNTSFDDPAGGVNTNSVVLKAEDKSTIESLAGSVAVGSKAGAGGAFAYNSIGNSVLASIDPSIVQRAATLDLLAKEASIIKSLSAAASGGQNLAISGSVSVNDIGNTTTSEFKNSTLDNGTTAATVRAEDTSSIQSLAGSVAVSLGAAAVGGAVADNSISNTAKANVSGSSLHDVASLTVEGKNASLIESLSAAAAGAAQGAFSGSASSNRTTNSTIGELAGSEITGSTASVNVSALDTATIRSLSGGAAIGGNVGVGAAVSVNRIANTTDAHVSGKKASTVGYDVTSLVVKGDSFATIETLAVGIGGGADVGVGGSVAVNLIDSNTWSYVDGGATVLAANNVGVIAESDDKITVAAGAAGVGISAAGVGASVTVNKIGGSTKAHISGSTTEVAARAADSTQKLTVNQGELTGAVNLAQGVDLASYARTNLAALRRTEQVTGVAVNAAATHSVETINTNVGGGQFAGVAGTFNVNIIGGETSAFVDSANINKAGTPAAGAGQAVQVKASDHAYANGFVGTLAIGPLGAGVGAAVDVNVFDRDTRAYVLNSPDVRSAGETRLSAVSTQGASSLAANAAGGLVGVAGTGVVTKFTSTTESYLRNSAATAGSVVVNAEHDSRMHTASGGVTIGAVAVGATFGVALDESVTRASIDGGSSVATSGQVDVNADSNTEIRGFVVSGAGAGGVAVAGMAQVSLIKNTTQAFVQNVTIGSVGQNATALSVTAKDAVLVDTKSGALAVDISGVGLGVGAGASVTKLENTVSAFVDNSTAHAANDVTVDSQAQRDLKNLALTLGVGGSVGIGGSAAVTLSGVALSGDANNELNQGNSGTLARVNDVSDRDQLQAGGNITTGTAISSSDLASVNSAARTGITGSVYPAALANKTSAQIAGSSSVTAGRDVRVKASEKDKAHVLAGAAGVGFVGVGGAVGVMDITNNVEALVTGSAQVTSQAGKIDVLAETARLDSGAKAAQVQTFQGAGGAVGLGAAVAINQMTNNVTANVGRGATTRINSGSGQLTVRATDTSDVDAEARGFNVGVVAAGAVVARAEKSGTASASVGNTNPTGLATSVTLASGKLAVEADRSGRVQAFSLAGTGGILSGSGSDARATDSGTSKAFLGNAVTVSGPSAAVSVKAGAEPNAFARAEGYSAAVFGSIGVSIAQATATPTVEASIGSGGSITAATLEVNAANRVPGGGNTADSEAVASGGAALVGANGSESTAQSSANVSATIGNNTQLAIGQATTVTAAGNTKEEASASGVTVGGLLAVGVNVANARANNTVTTARVGSGVTGNAGATLSVTATGGDDTFAESMAGTGGLLAGGAALANTRNNSTTVAELGGGTSGSALTAGSVVMRADHTATFNTKVNTINAAVIGASGAAGNSDVDSNVTARFAAGANIQTQDLDVLAINFSRKPFLGGGAFNATAGAGGLFSGAAALSAADIDNATRVTVGDGAVVNVTGNRDNPGRTNLTAVNDLDLKDKTNLDVGGAIPVAAAESHLRGNSNLAEVTMGTGSRLDSVGNVNLGARVRADVEASANAKTYGLAGAAAGTSEARVNAVNSVVIGTNARIRADGDVNLMAGRDGAGTFNNVTARARTDLFNKTAFPIVTNPEADAIINQSSTVSVGTGASVGSVKDVNLLAENGSNVADGQGVGKDLWREAAAAVASFFSNLVGGGDVSLDIRGGSSTVNANSGVTVNGTVAAGIQNKQFLTIDQNGTPSLQTEGVRFTTSVENLVTNIFNEITRLSRARAAYAGNPDAQAALDAEIARLRAELADLGYADTANNNIPVETVNATFINLDDVKARGGNINVTGNFLAGSGSLSAPNDTEITIVNASPRFLRTKRLTIEDTGGKVTFNQAPVSTNADINSRNRIGSPAAGFSSVLTAGTSPAPTITVHNTYNPSIQGAGEDSRAPDIQITGDVTNFTGTVNITNDKGSVVIQGTGNNAAPRIVANTINITTGKNFVQSFVPGFFNVGGDPRSIWDGEADVGENANTANPGSIGSRSSNAGLVGTGSIVAGNNVFISARYLNLNGLVQAGIPDWNLTLHASLDSTIQSFRDDYAAKVASGNKPANPRYTLTATDNRLGRIASFFNAETGQIELDGVKVEGGFMELFGEIVNTGGGSLKAVDGFGRINVVNNTSYDVVVNGLDAGNNIEAKIRITDLAQRHSDGRPKTFVYTRDQNGIVISQTVGDTLLSQTFPGFGRSTSFSPVTGQRFMWTTGLNRLNQSIGTASSTTVLGFIPAGSATYSSFITTPLQAVPIQEQVEFTPPVKPASQGNNYEYRFSQFATSGQQFVGRREWSNCNAWFIVCLSRTYFVEDTFQQGVKDFHTHSVKGDFPIPITFSGYDTGSINVTSGRSLVLAGAVRNPSGGATIASTGGSITTTGGVSVITANDISLGAQTGIGTSVLPIVTDLGAGALRATTTSGDVAIKEVKGDLRVDLVSTNSGNVSLSAEGGIAAAAAGSTARVIGNRVDLLASTGGIGTATQPLNIQTQSTTTGGLNATAANHVNIRQPSGDLRLINVTSLGGDVTLEAAGGTFIDANTQEVRDTRAESQLLALWNDLRLRSGAGAEQSRDDTIGALKAQRKRDYERYWNLRGVLPVFNAAGAITGFTAKPYAPGVNAELDALHAQLTALGISTASYDAAFAYTPTAAETNDSAQGFAWTDNELKTGLSRAILFKATSDTETRIEDPNVKGRNVTLIASGGVGKTSGSLTVDGTKSTLTEAERIALAAAEPDDVAGDPVSKQITVIQRDDVDVEATNSIKVTAGGAVFLGSEKDLNIDNVQSGQTVRIKGGIGIFDVSVTGPAIQGASTILEASTGAIGTQIKPFSMDLTAGATLTARAGQDIFITESAGDLSVAEMFTTKNVSLISVGSILDARGARPIAIQSDNLNLTAQGGSVGTSGNPLFVNLGSTGQLTASTPNGAGNDVFVTSPTTGMNVGPIQSGDQLGLAATVGNLNINAPVAAKGNASLAAGSRIHVAATGSVLSDNGNITTNSFALTMVDGADITVGVGTISITTAGDAILTGISTLNPTGSAIVITSGGRVLDGGGSLLDMIASTGPGAKLTINAVGGIGNDPLDIRVRNLDATSTTGGIHLEVQDSVNVGTVQAAGEVLLTAGGSITGNTITSSGGPVNTSAMGGQVNLANVSGQTGANVSGQTGVTLSTVSSAGGSIAANSAAGDVNVATASASQNVSLGAPAGSITATGTVAAAGGSVTMSASGDVAVTSPNSARAGLDVALSSMQGSISAAAITAGRDVNISAGQNVALGTVAATNAVTADAAGGNLTANSVTGNVVNLSALGTVSVPSGTAHVGSLLNLGADRIFATVDHTGRIVFLQANVSNRGGGPASLVELTVTSPLGVHFGTFSSLDAALLLNSGLDITNGFIANRATIANPVTLLLMDQNNRSPQPADIQLYAPNQPFALSLSGRVMHSNASVIHYNELTHSVISLVPGVNPDLRQNVENGLAIAEDAATGGPRERVADEPGEVVSYTQTPVALPDCTREPLPAECK